jgi:hypothetical protein
VFPAAGVKFALTESETLLAPETPYNQSDSPELPGTISDKIVFEISTEGGVRVTLSADDTYLNNIYKNEHIYNTAEMTIEQRAEFQALIGGELPFYSSREWIDDETLSLAASYLDKQGGAAARVIYVLVKNGVMYSYTADAPSNMGEGAARAAADSVRERVTILGERYTYRESASDISEPAGDQARTIRSAGALPVRADALPSWTNQTSLEFDVFTEAGAYVLALADGEPQAFAVADADGRCEFELQFEDSDGAHTVGLQAARGDIAGERVYEILLARQTTPILLRADDARVASGSFDLYAYSVPGAMVELTTPFSTMRGRANDAGYVYFSLSIKRGGENLYQAVATLDGYLDGRAETTLRRSTDAGEQAGDFRAIVQDISYRRLADNPSYYAGRNVEMRGRIARVSESNGYPAIVLYTANPRAGEWRDPIYILCDTLVKFEEGDIMTVLGVTRAQTYRYDGADIPVLDGAFYLK